jgi:hypothetical protein
MARELGTFIDLYWLPVGAGTHFQRFSLILYEGMAARLARRKRATLLHAALKIGRGDQYFTLEVTPAPADPNTRHEVTGPVGVRGADKLRLFRYQVCLREGDTLPDEEWAVVPALRLSEDSETVATAFARRLASTPGSRCPCFDRGSATFPRPHTNSSWLLPTRDQSETPPAWRTP